MIEWRRLYAKPAGSLPGGVVTQWGVGVITLLVLVFLTYWIYFGGGEEAAAVPGPASDQAPGGSFIDQMAAQVEAEALRAETRRAAPEATLVLPPVPDSVLRLVLAVDSARLPCGHDVAPLISMMDRNPPPMLACPLTPIHAPMPVGGNKLRYSGRRVVQFRLLWLADRVGYNTQLF